MKLFALKKKSTNQLFCIDPETDTESDWGFDGENERLFDRAYGYLGIYPSDFAESSVLFVTANREMLERLVSEGRWEYSPKIRFSDFSRDKDDLEIVELI